MVTALADDTTGVFVVSTETSSYVMDLSARTALRIPGAGAGSVPDLPPAALSDLRRDGEALPIRMLLLCEVGKPMCIVVDLRGDDVTTLRRTTLVRSIEPLETQDEQERTA